MVNGVLSQADLLDDSILQAKKRNVNTCELSFTICLQASRKLRVLFIKCSNNLSFEFGNYYNKTVYFCMRWDIDFLKL